MFSFTNATVDCGFYFEGFFTEVACVVPVGLTAFPGFSQRRPAATQTNRYSVHSSSLGPFHVLLRVCPSRFAVAGPLSC